MPCWIAMVADVKEILLTNTMGPWSRSPPMNPDNVHEGPVASALHPGRERSSEQKLWKGRQQRAVARENKSADGLLTTHLSCHNRETTHYHFGTGK